MLMLIKENCMNMTNIGGREKGQFNNVYKAPYLSFRDLKENDITQRISKQAYSNINHEKNLNFSIA